MLKPRMEAWSIVLAGHWNIAIFSPAWITQHLTTSKEIQLEVPVNGPAMIARLRFGSVALQLGPQRLTIAPTSGGDVALREAEAAARTILEQLPHTPVIAAGINFQFAESAPPDELQKVFKATDENALADSGAAIVETSVVRRLRLGDRIVNLALSLGDADKVTVDVNFHWDVTTAAAARDVLADAAVSCRDASMALMKSAYGCEVDS